MSLAIGSSVASLYTQELLSSRGNQASSGSSLPNMEDTYTPNSAIQQMKNVLQVQVDTAVSAQQDATMSNVMAIFGISNS